VALEVDLVAPDGKVWSGTARQVCAPAADGEIGILSGHIPVLSVLRRGELRINPVDGPVLRWIVEGGFLSVDSDQVTVVVDSFEATTGPTAH